MSIRFLGIEVDRKTDILALAAFLMALAGILYQFVGYLEGPDVKLFPPEQVLIFTKKMVSDEYVVFAAPMAYVNKGQPGYNAAIKSESIRYKLGGKTYEQKWQEFVYTGSTDNELEVTKQSDAHPLAINAGSTLSHETRFSPRSIRIKGNQDQDLNKNYMRWEDFLKEIATIKELELELCAEVYDESPVKVKCKIYISQNFVDHLQKYKWHAPTCWTD
jgi:hypothetical protein